MARGAFLPQVEAGFNSSNFHICINQSANTYNKRTTYTLLTERTFSVIMEVKEVIDMLAMNATEARKDWSSVIDSVIRKKPAFIKRTRDYMMLCSTDTLSQLVSGVAIQAEQFAEEDGSITLSAVDMDIVSHGADLKSAKNALAKDIIEYAEEYYAEFETYSAAPNRKGHLSYVMKALIAKSPEELEGAIICRPGKN